MCFVIKRSWFLILVEMASFRVNVVCFWNGSIRSSSSNVKYVGGRRKMFGYNSHMDLSEFKLFISSKIGIDTTRSTINKEFKLFIRCVARAFRDIVRGVTSLCTFDMLRHSRSASPRACPTPIWDGTRHPSPV